MDGLVELIRCVLAVWRGFGSEREGGAASSSSSSFPYLFRTWLT